MEFIFWERKGRNKQVNRYLQRVIGVMKELVGRSQEADSLDGISGGDWVGMIFKVRPEQQEE